MSESNQPARESPWQELFSAEANQAGGLRLEMRVLKKHGRPFLLLPRDPRAAAACLELYPAQTARARAAKSCLRWLLRISLPFGVEKTSLTVSPEDSFVKFLRPLIGQQSENLPCFGILAGNPATEGQRFLVLLFSSNQKPTAVVKTGFTEPAKELIAKEQNFLAAAPANTPGLPKLQGTFESPRLRALALDFFPGNSPRSDDQSAVLALLSSWLDRTKKIALSETPAWSRLEKAVAANEMRALELGQLRDRLVHPAIQHGDFAPWNIKVSFQGTWTVLDWERGELAGIPAWDWFHYVIQPAMLVERRPTSGLFQRIEHFLSSQPFKQYAEDAGIIGLERSLLLAYLLYMVTVVKPSEGLSQTHELLDALSEPPK